MHRALIYWILILLLFSFQIQAEQISTNQAPSNHQTKRMPDSLNSTNQNTVLTATYSLGELLGKNPIVISSVDSTYTFYPPVPEQWDLLGLKLNLKMDYSQTLIQGSALTASSNSVPLSTIPLSQGKGAISQWEIVLPQGLITPGALPSITVTSSLRNTNVFCPLDDFGNWVKISDESTITYTYKQKNFKPDLISLPYPFIREQWPTTDQSTIILPESTTDTLISALKLSAYLNGVSSWRGIKIDTALFKDLTDKQKNQAELIFVGTTDWLQQISNLFPKMPLKIDKEGFFHNEKDEKIPADTGVIFLVSSPWNPNYEAMIISGKTKNAINTALENFIQPDFSQIVYGDYVLLPNPPEKKKVKQSDTQKMIFEELGYPDQIARGRGTHTITYNILLPNNKKPNSFDFNIYLNHSSLVSNSKSLLMLNINNIPIETLNLTQSNERNFLWKINIKGELLLPGKNTIDMVYSFHIANEQFCDPLYPNIVWGVIEGKSYLTVNFDDRVPKVPLNLFPVPFDDNTIIVIPEKMTPSEQTSLFTLVDKLSFELKKKSSSIQFETVDHLDKNTLKKSNVILFGNVLNNPMVQSAVKKTPLENFKTTGLVQKENIHPIPESNYPYGFIGLFDSPWNTHNAILIIFGKDEQALSTSVNTLVSLNPATQAKLSGNVAIINENGFTHFFNTLETQNQINMRIMIYTLLGILLFILSIGYIARKIISKFEQNKKKGTL
ncbi:MAG: cellulose biosynthesis cyclic di-GMP-binding regulatory protein BcsB [Proteobacteria bacterium]|nr:cellulose biosynthesis cyclic di-GMP-binding regulatory protein BcsB [Pseudomonadota bacterium]